MRRRRATGVDSFELPFEPRGGCFVEHAAGQRTLERGLRSVVMAGDPGTGATLANELLHRLVEIEVEFHERVELLHLHLRFPRGVPPVADDSADRDPVPLFRNAWSFFR
jgi:hypothetical protein